MKKIRCPLHEDRVASLAIYSEHAYCFGGCGRLPLAVLGMKPTEVPPVIAEDLTKTFEWVDSLPLTRQRGFEFPTDDRGFYIVWPDRTFYKKRIFEPGDGPKYIGPRGVQASPLWVRRQHPSTTIFVVEGELNGLSIAKAFPSQSVVSLGSASEFGRAKVKDLLVNLYKHANLCIVVDDDPAGLKAAIEVKKCLERVRVCLMDKDANEILMTQGVNAIRDGVVRGLVV